MQYFEFKDIDGDDIKIEINFKLLRARAIAIVYNWNGEVISRNKHVGWWHANNLAKFFKVLRNNIGKMSSDTREKYLDFIDKLEDKYTIKK